MDESVRTEFGPRPGRLRGALLVTVLGVVLLAAAASVVWFTSGSRSVPPTVLLGIVGLLLAGVGVSMLWTAVRPSTLTVDAEGVHVRTRGRQVDLRWTDIDSWSVGVPQGYPARKVRREMLLATPAGHVTEPNAGPRRLLWSPQRRRWIICEPILTDGTTDEIVAAMNTYAPNKHNPTDQSS